MTALALSSVAAAQPACEARVERFLASGAVAEPPDGSCAAAELVAAVHAADEELASAHAEHVLREGSTGRISTLAEALAAASPRSRPHPSEGAVREALLDALAIYDCELLRTLLARLAPACRQVPDVVDLPYVRFERSAAHFHFDQWQCALGPREESVLVESRVSTRIDRAAFGYVIRVTTSGAWLGNASEGEGSSEDTWIVSDAGSAPTVILHASSARGTARESFPGGRRSTRRYAHGRDVSVVGERVVVRQVGREWRGAIGTFVSAGDRLRRVR